MTQYPAFRPSRRSFLTAAGATVLGVGALAACGPDTNENGGNGSSTGPGGFKMPKHIPFSGPAPDLPPNELGVNAGYLSYPALDSLTRSVTEPPGDGKPITVLTQHWGSARPPMEQNSWWQNLNGLLGSDLDVQLVPGPDYETKYSTTVAGGTMPDLFTVLPSPRQPAFLESQAVDLTDHLAGDAIAKYPNLANNPASAWPYTLFNGRIYTLPIFRGLLSGVICYQRTDLLEEKGLNIAPASFEEFFDWASELNDPANNRWAFSSFPYEFLRGTLGLPQVWEENDGVFKSAWEREEQEAFLAAGKRIVDAGLVHPEGFTGTGMKERFVNGECYFIRDSLAAWGGFYGQFATAYPDREVTDFDITGVPMFNFDSGTTGAPWRPKDVPIVSAISKGAEDRIETMLAVMNFLAAPLGSQEQLDGRRGVEGKHYTVVDGVPTPTDLGQAESFWPTDLVDAPYVINHQYRQSTTGLHEFQSSLAPVAIANPADVLYSETHLNSGAALTAAIEDATNEILQGRQGIETWAQVVSDYKAKGGDAIKAELEEAFAAANG